MPSRKRSPIAYEPQFGAGIFRSPEDIAEDLAAIENALATDEADDTTEMASSGDLPRMAKGNASPAPRTVSERLNERPNVRTNERSRVRHSFDVWQDQLLSLTEIQTQLFTRTGRKPKLGDLVQEALDEYIDRRRERTNVRTNERPYDRRQG